MSSKWKDNIDLEAQIRIVAANVGAQVYRGGRSPPGDEASITFPEGSDEAQLDKQHQTNLEEIAIPLDVDELNSWEMVEENCEPDDIVLGEVQEPTTQLGPDGLPATHTCEHCNRIVIRWTSLKETQRLLVSRSREELDHAAESGCSLLAWLRWHVYSCLANPPSRRSEIYLLFAPERGNNQTLGSIRGEFIDWGANKQGVKGKGECGPFWFVTPKDNAAAGFVKSRPVNLSVSSEESFKTAAAWIEECHAEHPNCATPNDGLLPTRVLELGDNNTVRLVDSASVPGELQYAALSYCWGGPQEQKTTVNNVYEREDEGMDVFELPRSLRDAVTVTERLGLRYLWIDSICIVQDDEDDKA